MPHREQIYLCEPLHRLNTTHMSYVEGGGAYPMVLMLNPSIVSVIDDLSIFRDAPPGTCAAAILCCF